jgi:hypothetical protein
MRYLLLAGIVPVALAAAGCAVNSGIVPVDQNTFKVSRQAASGFSDFGNLKPEAMNEAQQYCKDQQNTLVVLNVKEARPSSGPGDFPRAEITFKCWDATQINAIRAECNEQRIKKFIKGFRAAVECSSPKVIAAWRERQYPYMDLIELYEAASLVGAEKVDSGKLSEAEYKLQLAELRSRMTAEDQRRRLAVANIQTAQVQAQAADTQANAAILQGLSAFQAANRPNSTYNVNVCNAGPGQANTCSYPR